MIERKIKNNKTHENEELAHTYTLLAHTTIVSIPITQCQHMRALYLYRLHSVSTCEHCIYADYTVSAHTSIVSIPITQCQHM